MSGAMPYYFEKGELLRRLEDEINGSHPRAIKILKALREPGRDLWNNFLFRGPVQPATGLAQSADETKDGKHFKEHWLGKPTNVTEQSQETSVADDPDAGCRDTDTGNSKDPPPPTTGWWWAYKGKADEVLGLTLTRGLEVALGFAPSQSLDTIDPDKDPKRHWPVTIFWVCGHRWFEGWVTWRTDPDGHTGHVVILLTTPGFNSGTVSREPGRTNPPAGQQSRAVKQVSSLPTVDEHHGLWLVSHKEHRRAWAAPYPEDAKASAKGDWRPPYLINVDCGAVEVYDMSDVDDGLKRPFTFVPGVLNI